VTQENTQAVSAESATAQTQNMHNGIDLAGLDDIFSLAAKDELATLAEQLKENPDEDTSPEGAEAEAKPDEAQPETPKAEDKPEPKGAEKRIKQLTAQKSEVQKQLFEANKQVELYDSAFQMLQEQNTALQNRLAQYEDIDPRMQKLENLELQQKLEARQKELEAQYTEKWKEVEVQARAEVYKEQILEQIHSAAREFDGVEPHEIAIVMQSSGYDGAAPRDIAKKIAEHREKLYQKKFGVQAKPAPKTVTPQGKIPVRSSMTKAEIIADVERELAHKFK